MRLRVTRGDSRGVEVLLFCVVILVAVFIFKVALALFTAVPRWIHDRIVFQPAYFSKRP